MASSQHVWGTGEGGAGECASEPEKTYPVLKECMETQEKRWKRERRVDGQSQG